MGRSRSFLYVVGTRPNFMKMAPVLEAMRRAAPGDRHLLVHTGQHYHHEMSRRFFEDLDVPVADYHLGVGGLSRAAQIARMVERLGAVLDRECPDVVVVAGDGDSTLAGGLAAVQAGARLAHVEAGLRSFDLDMPEEVNRVIVDHASEMLFIHSLEARRNLAREGVPQKQVHFCGNTMIDTLVRLAPRTDGRVALERHGIKRRYLLVTLHRPALVDSSVLDRVMTALDALAHELDVVFPVHPRTAKALARNGATCSRIRILPPAGPLDFLAMQRHAAGVLTDSGGVQEETTFLGVPCFTLRDNTERPVTVSHGTNHLFGLSPERILEIPALLSDGGGAARHARQLFGWDGRASERIAQVLNASAERARSDSTASNGQASLRRGRGRRRRAARAP